MDIIKFGVDVQNRSHKVNIIALYNYKHSESNIKMIQLYKITNIRIILVFKTTGERTYHIKRKASVCFDS